MRASRASCSARTIPSPARAARWSISSPSSASTTTRRRSAACARTECGRLLVRVLRRAPRTRPCGMKSAPRRRLATRRRASPLDPSGRRPRGDETRRDVGARRRRSHVPHALAALRRERRRAPRRRHAHGARSARRPRDHAARRLRLDAPAAAHRLRADRAARRRNGSATATSRRSSSRRSRMPAWSRSRDRRVSDFGAAQPSAFTLEHCFGLLDQPRYEVSCALDGPGHRDRRHAVGRQPRARRAPVRHAAFSGRSTAASCSSRTSARRRTAIERMLYQLQHAGVLARQRAILLGQFTEYALSANDGGYDIDTAVAHLRDVCRTPVFTGLAVRPRRRQAHASGRRPLRPHGARRARDARLFRLCRLNPRRASRIRDVTWAQEEAKLRAVRLAVFVVEQNIPGRARVGRARRRERARDRRGSRRRADRLRPAPARRPHRATGRAVGLARAGSRRGAPAASHRACARARPRRACCSTRRSTRCLSTLATGSRRRVRPFMEAGIPHQEMARMLAP